METMEHLRQQYPYAYCYRSLVLAGCGLLSSSCVAPPSISTERLCPFTGSELILEVQAIAPNPPLTPALIQATADVVLERVTELNAFPASIVWDESGHITVQLPPDADVEQASQWLRSQGELTFRPQKAESATAELNTLFRERQAIPVTDAAALAAINANILALFDAPQISSGDVRDAWVTVRTPEQFIEIGVEFNEVGAQNFTEFTREIAGTGQAVGIFLDDMLISAPVVDASFAETGIPGNEAVIAGAFSMAEAEEIAAQIRSGAFPAPTSIASLQPINLNASCEPVAGN